MYSNTSLSGSDALLLLQGLGMTLFIFVVSFTAGSIAGVVLGLVRQARVPVLSQLALVYVELFRNSPLLVQLFLIYFGLPISFGIRLSPLTAGLLTLMINTGAFMAVITQAAVDEVPRGQWEASRAYGLGYVKTMRHVILPQAVQTMIPPVVSLAVSQLQVSSLVSVIGVLELTRVGSNLNLRTLQPFVVWPIVAAGYFLVSKPLSVLADRAEARLRGRGRTVRVALAEGPA
ncbi:MAG: amino acid ABC transporter permease [Parafilimonas terrae]|nr:amino acid ABC transporter permease [Parafilimonas terrae]